MDPDSDRSSASNEKTVDEIIQKHFDQSSSQSSTQDLTTNKSDNDLVVGDDKNEGELSDSDDEPDVELTDEELQFQKAKVVQLKDEGNSSFRKGDYDEAISKYREGLSLCRHKAMSTERAIMYSNRAASELKLNHAKPAIQSASKAIKYNPTYSKAYLRRAKAHDMDGKLDESLEDYTKVLELDPASKEAAEALPDLNRRITERNEKMKTEMMEKLKDLGNLVLRPFGLSTNNFQMTQDPSTGGYSFNFKQN